MTVPEASTGARAARRSSATAWWPAGLIAIAVVAAYANSFRGAFVLDDEKAILGNPTLRSFWSALFPPHGEGLTVEGRPLLNLSLALNHAISGLQPWSYHAFNLLVHGLAALTLFGIVRRTLVRPEAGERAVGGRRSGRTIQDQATPIALGVALLWALHPLETESVTYVVQRTESLMGLFYLITLYAFIRGADAGDRRWLIGSAIACLAGMAIKEVMVSAPLIVWLYDRTFVAGTFAAAWRRRRGYYLGLAASWLVLAALVVGAGDRGGTIGPQSGVAWWQYAMTQSCTVVHYVGLGPWPSPLIFDYGADFVTWAQALPWGAIDLALLAATTWALWRRPPLGFLGAWYFVILAPTTSVVGGTRQMVADHRMYLSLAALTALAVLVGWRLVGRRLWPIVGVVAVLFGGLTAQRNEAYRSERALYTDTVAKRPNNVHARYNLGKVLGDAGEWPAAIEQDEAAVALAPKMAGAHYNLANAFDAVGRPADAVAQYEEAIRIDPRYGKAHYNLGNTLLELGRKAEAVEQFRAAVSIDPSDFEARDNLGGVLLDLGRLDEAKAEFLAVLRLNPNLIEPHCNLGAVYYLKGNLGEAAAEYERALAINSRFEPARQGLARVKAAAGNRAAQPKE